MNPDNQQCLSKLPHGPGFRFVDEVLEVVPGVRARGTVRVPERSEYLDGHFPGNPMMPGVLLVEACAQLAGILAHSDSSASMPTALKLAAIRQVKFPGTALPGELVDLLAEQTLRLGNLIQARVCAQVGERVVLEGEVVLGG